MRGENHGGNRETGAGGGMMPSGFKPLVLPTAEKRLAYSISELAQLVGVSRPTIYSWMRLTGFPVLRVGGVVRIPAGAFEEWMNEQAGVNA